MANPPSPVVRNLIVCEEIITDPKNPKRVSLLNLVHSIRPMRQPPYPLVQPRLAVFLQLTGCRGRGEVRVAIREADTDEVIFTTETHRVAFPNNPLALHGFRFRLFGCRFPEPGLYWLEFFFDNQVLGQQPITLLE
jgi:hypothetical protein